MENKLVILKKQYNFLRIETDKIAVNEYGMDKDGGFPSKEKLKDYIFNNRSKLEELNIIRNQIESLEWELMTPEERERKLEVARKIKAKTSGNQNQ